MRCAVRGARLSAGHSRCLCYGGDIDERLVLHCATNLTSTFASRCKRSSLLRYFLFDFDLHRLFSFTGSAWKVRLFIDHSGRGLMNLLGGILLVARNIPNGGPKQLIFFLLKKKKRRNNATLNRAFNCDKQFNFCSILIRCEQQNEVNK